MKLSEKHVSGKNKAAAKAAIIAKRALLEYWASTGIPFKGGRVPAPGEHFEVDWFPRSLRDFCRWDGSQNSPSVGPFQATAFQTLSTYEDEKRLVKALIAKLSKLELSTVGRLDPKQALRDTEAQLAVERQLRAGALLGYRSARRESRSFEIAYLREKRAHEESIDQLQAMLTRAKEEAAALRSENAALTAAMRKISPIKAVR